MGGQMPGPGGAWPMQPKPMQDPYCLSILLSHYGMLNVGKRARHARVFPRPHAGMGPGPGPMPGQPGPGVGVGPGGMAPGPMPHVGMGPCPGGPGGPGPGPCPAACGPQGPGPCPGACAPNPCGPNPCNPNMGVPGPGVGPMPGGVGGMGCGGMGVGPGPVPGAGVPAPGGPVPGGGWPAKPSGAQGAFHAFRACQRAACAWLFASFVFQGGAGGPGASRKVHSLSLRLRGSSLRVASWKFLGNSDMSNLGTYGISNASHRRHACGLAAAYQSHACGSSADLDASHKAQPPFRQKLSTNQSVADANMAIQEHLSVF